MSTSDVPGANPANHDELHDGCWAEHEDGSMILVQGLEDPNSVIYLIFDMVPDPPVEYRNAMPQNEFEEMFSWDVDNDDSIKWTWHDKTPFPWSRVMKDFAPGEKQISALTILSAAQRVAESLNLRADKLSSVPRAQGTARGLMQRLTRTVARHLRK